MIMSNLEQLKLYAGEIAKQHKIHGPKRRFSIQFPKIKEDNEIIKKAYKFTDEEVRSKSNIIPAAEWLLDNYYLLEEQFKEIQLTLDKKNYRKLPVLKTGNHVGFPRVYSIAADITEYLYGEITEENIIAFLEGYQEYSPLTSKELWAFPIMLRICLLERIKQVAIYIYETMQLRKLGEQWAEKLLNCLAAVREENKPQEEFRKIIQAHESEIGYLKPAYTERLLHRLREEGVDASPIIRWVDGKLAVYQTNADDIVNQVHQEQASYQVSIGNAITSLRLVSSLKWEDIYEEISILHRILKQDPAKIYSLMDFTTRNFYRQKIEELSIKYNIDEIDVAVMAIECAREDMNNSDDKFNHVGYYIIDDGLGKLKEKLGDRRTKNKNHNNTFVYFSSISILTLGIWFSFLVGIQKTTDYNELSGKILSAVICFLPIWSISVGIINWIVIKISKPYHIPKLELKESIPEEYRTMVVIPTLLTDEKRVTEIIEQMEVIYLANQDENIHFALIGDFKDGPEEHNESDEAIIETGSRLIKELNQRYGRSDIFYFFHRYRQWNANQCSWMGWERKRGALTEFNALLEGDDNTSFSVQVGDLSILGKIKYVITLDADTNLPRDTAKKLIGAMAHPLNRPVLNKDKTRVIEGYGLIQPRIGVSVDSASRSFFALTFSGQTGIDPYTTAVSDVYQDLFHEGIFTGKGIFDPKVFSQVLKEAIPENAVLSHDLLEGSYVRAGLATDIELIDGYPAHYIGYSLRLHRWVRGDWQLLPWLFSKVKNKQGVKVDNPINSISKWKIIDNLRRSLLSPALYLLIVLSFLMLPGSLVLWLGLALLTFLQPLMTDLAGKLVSGTKKHYRLRLSSFFEGTRTLLNQIFLSFVFLSHQAYLMTDAILRSVWRVTVSHKNMLEWVTAADSDRKFKGKFSDYWHKMKVPVFISLLIYIASLIIRPGIWYLSGIATVAWILSPYIAWKIGQQKGKRTPSLSEEQILYLRRIARKTWKYFEHLVTEEENWLPPDNYQQEPYLGIAHRTSPTNIGLYLIAVLSARDLGFIGSYKAIDRIESTINILKKLEKWEGHFYNWYNTETLEPLSPLYVSTVDNGNLVCYLITLMQGLNEIWKRPLIDKENISGLYDILAVDLGIENIEHISILQVLLNSEQVNIMEWQMLLEDLKGQNEDLDSFIREYEKEIISFTPWVKQLQKIPTTLLNENRPYTNTSKKMSELLEKLNGSLSIQYLYDNYLEILKGLSETLASLNRDVGNSPGYIEARNWLKQLEISLGESYSAMKVFYARIRKLQRDIESLVHEMDFSLLYHEKKELFAIGYNVEDGELSKSYYDLLASEARQASFVAIAKGDIPQKHWFKLGRSLSLTGDLRVLISWTGTMFEYLMPLLIMKSYDNTLLDETYTGVVRVQKQYAEQFRLPWGASESGFYAFDLHLNYQYKAFGVPSLGLKRGLVKDLVIAPYATMLALIIEPVLAYKNLEALIAEGMEGPYGLYEAIDYTQERLSRKKKSNIVKSFMAHHQGMILAAIDNHLNNNIMQMRFHSVPMVKATELLLQERIPKREIFIKDNEEIIGREIEGDRSHQEILARRTFQAPRPSSIPETCILSNGNYSVLLTDSGAGYSTYMGQAITRWRSDPTRDDWGMMFYIANLNSNNYWSAAYQPTGMEPEEYKVTFEADHAIYFRRDGNIVTKTEAMVSPEFNGEVRSITLTNNSNSGRMMEVTSYFEVVLGLLHADIAHPAFTNLFIRTEYLDNINTIIANRRPRSAEERENGSKPLWMYHTMVTEGEVVGSIQYETDRAKFIGRGRTLQNPQVMDPEFPLSNTAGAVLDPIASLRVRVFIPAGKTAKISYITGVAESREEAVSLIKGYQNAHMSNRTLELAWTHSQVELRYLNLTAGQANLFQSMISPILFGQTPKDWKQEMIKNNRKGLTALWPYGISGDLPIVVVRIKQMNHIEIVKQMLTAHEYFRLKGLTIDLVILNEYGNSYEQPVRDRIHELIAISNARELIDKPGGVFVRESTNIPQDDLNLLLCIARIVINGENGSIASQLEKNEDIRQLPLLATKKINYRLLKNKTLTLPQNLLYKNDYGGFSEDGKEYIIYLKNRETTPMPWSNIISNDILGFLVTESGSGYTWCMNSRENKLTPWSNDPIRDPAGEVLYIRDDNTGEFWTATPLPIRATGPYLIRHGQGYSAFENFQNGILAQQTMFVVKNQPVKLIRITIENCTDKPRSISLVYYAEWVLGVNREYNPLWFIVSEFDELNNSILAYNYFNEEYSRRVAFLSCSSPISSYTSLRNEFFGRNGCLTHPLSMNASHFSNRAVISYDPCAAIQIKIDIPLEDKRKFCFFLAKARIKNMPYS
jgi:cyclic beta-1,2-glucan synthetase